MAQTAKLESDEQGAIEIQKPDFERAIKVLNHDISPTEEKNAESRGDLSAAWKIIADECHVNKSAAKAFHKLATASDEKKDDWLRSFYGLLKAAGIGISRDLVDQMADCDAPTMPIDETVRNGLATLQPELTH